MNKKLIEVCITADGTHHIAWKTAFVTTEDLERMDSGVAFSTIEKERMENENSRVQWINNIFDSIKDMLNNQPKKGSNHENRR